MEAHRRRDVDHVDRCFRERRLRGRFRSANRPSIRQGRLSAETPGAKENAAGIPGLVIPSPFFDVAIDPAGRLWVANTGRHSLESYRPDGSLITSWGRASAGIEDFSGCCNPSHFAIGRDGSFVTSEKGIVRIKLHGPTGRLIGVVATAREFPAGAVGLDVAIDTEDRVLVLDPSTSTIRRYVRKAALGESS
ncbi:MAG: hypothetical protein HY716_04860 [Planctomycetes bacterium]|nr:hypothetical protein [Planctomycetota bacterium]